jgi:hypothetical protein
LPRIVPLILATALFMENMDATVIATSLAAIAAVVGGICAVSTVMFMRLPAGAGHALTRQPQAR